MLISQIWEGRNMIRSVRQYLAYRRKKTEADRYKKLLLDIRSLAQIFGIDITKYSDEEIENCLIEAGRSMSQLGCSAAEVHEAFKSLGSCRESTVLRR